MEMKNSITHILLNAKKKIANIKKNKKGENAMKFETINELLEKYKKETVYHDTRSKLSIVYKVQNPNAGFPFEEGELKTYKYYIERIRCSARIFDLSEVETAQAELEALKIFEQRHKNLIDLHNDYNGITNESLKSIYADMCENSASANAVIRIIKSIKSVDLPSHDEDLFAYLCGCFARQYQPYIETLIIATIDEKREELKQVRRKEEEKHEAARLKAEKKENKRQANSKNDFDEGPEDEIK